MFGGTGAVCDVDAVARLHAAITELASVGLDTHTDAELTGLWQELETVRNRLAVLDHRLIGEVQFRHLPETAGCPSTAVFARQVLRVGIGEARRRVKAADALGPRRALTGEPLPPIYANLAQASAAGEISPPAAAVIVDTIDKLPDAVRATEDLAVENSLLEQARMLHLENLQTVAGRVSALPDPDGVLRDEEYRRRHREVNLQQRPDGSGRLTGECTAELTERLRGLFDTLARPKPQTESGKDPRSGRATAPRRPAGRPHPAHPGRAATRLRRRHHHRAGHHGRTRRPHRPGHRHHRARGNNQRHRSHPLARRRRPGLGFPRNREGLRYAAAGWSAVIFSKAAGDRKDALLCRRRVL
jgi:hypothetical protein